MLHNYRGNHPYMSPTLPVCPQHFDTFYNPFLYIIFPDVQTKPWLPNVVNKISFRRDFSFLSTGKGGGVGTQVHKVFSHLLFSLELIPGSFLFNLIFCSGTCSGTVMCGERTLWKLSDFDKCLPPALKMAGQKRGPTSPPLLLLHKYILYIPPAESAGFF